MNLDNSSNNSQPKFIRSPSRLVFIEDLINGLWNDTDKLMMTRYGNIKRSRIIGTIIDKREVIDDAQNESFIADTEKSRSRISFLIDDGTGRVWATLWGADPKDFEKYQKGDLILLVGLIRSYRNQPTISFDFIVKIVNPNVEINFRLEILRRRKFEPKFEFEQNKNIEFSDFDLNFSKDQNPSKNNDSNQEFELNYPEINDIDYINQIQEKKVNDQINIENKPKSKRKEQISTKTPNSPDLTENNLTQQILDYITQNDQGDGVSIKNISKDLNIQDSQLKKIVEKLNQDVKIYKTSPGNYSVY
jgi:RPA family protein